MNIKKICATIFIALFCMASGCPPNQANQPNQPNLPSSEEAMNQSQEIKTCTVDLDKTDGRWDECLQGKVEKIREVTQHFYVLKMPHIKDKLKDALIQGKEPRYGLYDTYRENSPYLTKVFGSSLVNEFKDVARSLLKTGYWPPSHGVYSVATNDDNSKEAVLLREVIRINLVYEAHLHCTAIVASGKDGMYLGRNLDFFESKFLKDLVIHVKFKKAGKVVFEGNTFAGYLGVLDGFTTGTDNRIAVAMNYRAKTGNPTADLTQPFQLPSFALRHVLEEGFSYDKALEYLQTTKLTAPVYFTVAGNQANQGAIIWRNPANTVDTKKLDDRKFYLVQTNYDGRSPAYDNRDGPVISALDSLGKNSLSLDLLFRMLSVPPTLQKNGDFATVYTSVVHLGDKESSSLFRAR